MILGRRRLGAASFTLAVSAAALAPASAVALRSDPTPRYFWDANDDGTPDDASVSVDAEGGSWTSAKGNLLTDATEQWADNTDFDPHRVIGAETGPYDVYIDGTAPSCGPFDGALAATCRTTQVHYFAQDPTEVQYYRIPNMDTYFNTATYTFSFSTSGPPAGTVDFQGIATHELGHWVRLIDVYDAGDSCVHSNQRDTMCGIFYSEADTYFARTLTTDDKDSANAVYP